MHIRSCLFTFELKDSANKTRMKRMLHYYRYYIIMLVQRSLVKVDLSLMRNYYNLVSLSSIIPGHVIIQYPSFLDLQNNHQTPHAFNFFSFMTINRLWFCLKYTYT